MTQPPEPTTKPLRGTHDLGEIVGYSYRLYLRDFVPFFGLALLTLPFQLLTAVMRNQITDDWGDAAADWSNLGSVLVIMLVLAALAHAANEATAGTRPS